MKNKDAKALAKHRKDTYKREQNRVRGVIGRVASHKQEAAQLTTVFREDIRRALVESRRLISDADRAAFLSWVTKLRAAGVAHTSDVIAFAPVRSLGKSKRMPFAAELEWTIARLQPHIDQLREFRSKVSLLNDAFWAGRSSDTSKILDDIESTFGESLWSIELALGLAQHHAGLESQKSYLKKVKEQWKAGLPAYLAHFFSIRNEDRSTIRLFRDDASRRISNTKLGVQAQTYLRFKIADELKVAESDLSSILRTEQLQSIIDIYETSIEVIQRLIRSSRHSRYSKVIAKCVEAWSGIEDFRLTKIGAAIGIVPKHALPMRAAAASYRLIEGKPAWAYLASRRAHANDPSDIWSGIENVLTASICNRAPEDDESSPWASLNKALLSTLERTDEFESGSGVLEKFARNFRALHGAVALGDFVAFAIGNTVGSQISVGASSLNTPTWGPEDLLLASGDARVWIAGQLDIANSGGLRAVLATEQPSSVNSFGHGVVGYLRALHLQHTAPALALENLREIVTTDLPPILRGFVVSLRIDVAIHEGERALAIADIADEAARSTAVRNILPIEGAIEGREWSDLALTANKLDLAIALDVMWRKTANDLYGSFLRFAFEDYLAEQSCDLPSKIIVPTSEPRSKVIYFLRYVAVPPVMDLTGLFEASRAVTEERSAVCETLRIGNPERASLYSDEINAIRHQLIIEDGLRLVDNSRINVDTAAISRWAEQRYRESFGRYRALVDAGIGVADDFDEVVRQLNKHTTAEAGGFFNVPDNEADTLLLEMTLSIRDQFLNNPEHGLEFFLGKRIRHGTVTGHLRGPVEAAKLITQRDSEEGDYRRNDEWLAKLTFEGPACSGALDKAFRNFARSYDEMHRRLKDERLHVQSKQHPKGVFDIIIAPLTFRLFRSVVKHDLTFETFADSCYSIFWALLEPSLVVARALLSPEAKDHAARLFDELHSHARENAVHDDAYHELSLAIRNSAAEVQRQFDSMAEWLRPIQTERAARRFELSEVIEINVESALKTHSAYEPKVQRDVDQNVRVPAGLLAILYDIIFVIIGNACVRSASGLRPEIALSCHIDKQREILRLVGVNSVGPTVDRAAAEVKLDRIRRRIAAGDIQSGALAEKESGLLKIANITKQSKRGNLEFGFRDNNTFETCVELSVVLDEGSLALTPAMDDENSAG